MENRQYQTAFFIAKISEFLGWAIIIVGLVAALASWRENGAGVAMATIAVSAVTGILCVFLSQLTLIFIDTENNTRQTLLETRKTNAMLAETLGTIVANLNRLIGTGGSKQ